MPPNGATVWSPFDRATKYFDPAARDYMFNLVVDDLDGALRQVREGGAELVGAIEEQDYGRFGWFMDPEGNKVELWQPKAHTAALLAPRTAQLATRRLPPEAPPSPARAADRSSTATRPAPRGT